MKVFCSTCGDALLKKETFKCSNCGKILCAIHTFIRVDADNISITSNAPKLCIECYKTKHNTVFSFHAIS